MEPRALLIHYKTGVFREPWNNIINTAHYKGTQYCVNIVHHVDYKLSLTLEGGGSIVSTWTTDLVN